MLEKVFRDCKDQDISISFSLSNSENYNYVDEEHIKTQLSTLTVTENIDVCTMIGIPVDAEGIDFQVHKLCSYPEDKYQMNILTPLSLIAGSDVIDTHSANKLGKYLCVSGAHEETIKFLSKPDSIHKNAPLLLEVKSRKSKAAIDVVDIDNMALTVNLITNVELDLFQQCLERVVTQSQFRAYLSKVVVLASTGHTSWCFYYDQQFEENSEFKRVRIMRITDSDINVIWNGISKAVLDQGCRFFLTTHGRAIIKSLLRNTCNVDLHSIRVHLSSISHATVYYITIPSIAGEVSSRVKTYAFKVMHDPVKFQHEISTLRRIKSAWDLERPFYYISDSSDTALCLTFHATDSVVLVKPGRLYDWFLDLDTPTELGIIVMRPALRKRNTARDGDDLIFSQLLETLSEVHKAGIRHCDLRSCNCLKFNDGWQVVDFDLAISAESGSDICWCSLRVGTEQFNRVGYGVVRKWTEMDGGKPEFMTVEWSANDDIEMLHRACRELYI